ncbi:MAG: hypothetical protein HOV71_14685 [Hamadaea sp.]|nr:hypothetical protein [Hamadaea sp.]NUR49374.1 hypothetical protein [Hamadaea sp.]NUT04436.1 hypothetical protein [Hamadaea sp.]
MRADVTRAEDEVLIEALKVAASVLKSAEIPFVLAGGYAVYAHGGASSDHDVDFLIKAEDVDRSLEAMTAAGLKTHRPPEDWLVKAYHEGTLVDLIHRPVDREVDDDTLADSTVMKVAALSMPVLSPTTLMVHKLLTFNEHYCDYSKGLPLARSLRERIDWSRVRRETKESPYAAAFIRLAELLEITPPQLETGDA